MTRFKLNARFFGGTGLLIIFGIIIIPLYIGLINSGIGELPSNIIQIQEGVRKDLPTNPIPFLIIAGLALIVILIVKREQKKRAGS